MNTTLITNIGNIYSPDTAAAYGTIKHWPQVWLMIEGERIAEIGTGAAPSCTTIIDAGGGMVLPGFIDAHTHPVFWKTREDEFVMRIEGKTYEQIAAAGGGIRNSVRRFREASTTELLQVTRQRLKKFPACGTTTIEAKSGYGLSLRDEIRTLEIIQELNDSEDLDLIPTFLGAHEIPDEYQDDRSGYLRLLIDEMLPEVSRRNLAGYCDVFCEKGVFSIDETRQILKAAGKYGLKFRIHADELQSGFGGAELAAEMGAVTADHLITISDSAIGELAKAGVIPVLLPGTTFFLGKDSYAPARKMIAAGCQVAVATDFNPGSSATQNMQLMWTIAALKLKMLPSEILWATTYTAARSLNLHHDRGFIAPGARADLIILDCPNLNYLPYHYGVNHVIKTIKNGQIIFEAGV